jgi:3',5'-cyclic-nucleotide phosphodiesterase
MDMAKHFELVKKTLYQNNFDRTNEESRLPGLQLLMKVADIWIVSRPFEMADKWYDILNEEFFHQGDVEKETGIRLTSPLNDRETANKPKSHISFYGFVSLPLRTVVVRLDRLLEVNVNNDQANLEKWKVLAKRLHSDKQFRHPTGVC